MSRGAEGICSLGGLGLWFCGCAVLLEERSRSVKRRGWRGFPARSWLFRITSVSVPGVATEFFEFGDIFFAVVAEAALLEGEVGEFLAVEIEDLGLEEGFVGGWIGFVGDLAGEFFAAESVEAGFERSDAEETPFGVADGLERAFFVVVGGGVFTDDAGDVLFVDGDVVSWEEDGAAGQTGFDGAEGRFGPTCFGAWTAA